MAEANTILLAILVVGILGLLGFTVYGYLKEDKSITALAADTTNVNKAVIQLAASLDTLTKTTGGIDTNVNEFIKTSSEYYKTNTAAIVAINKLLMDMQASVFTKQDLVKLVDAVNARVQEMNKGNFRGYFSPNDTADVITKTLIDIQSQMLKNTEAYLLSSANMSNYIQSIVGKNAPSLSDFNTTNNNLKSLSETVNKNNIDLTNKIQVVSDKLDKTITTLDSYILKWSTLPSTTPTGTSLTNYCYRYAIDPMRTLFYKSDNCTPQWGWGANDSNVGEGGPIKGFTTPQPNTTKYCYRYASNPMRTLFYKSDNCAPQWGWDFNDPNVGTGGEVYLYSTPQPNTTKYCYRYAFNPMRTLFYKSDNCTPQWGWGANDSNVGTGGEVWVPN